MIRRRFTPFTLIAICCLFVFSLFLGGKSQVFAAVENPQSGSVGIQGKIPSEPPKIAPTITTPTNGQSFSQTPITVGGLCTKGLLVKVFSNNVFIGSVDCTNGSYSLQVDLFSGRNDLVARIFDQFDQAGPDSNVVTVTFNDNQFNPINGEQFILTSNYARRGANPGQSLTWPVILDGGTGPYAISVDWGDGKASDLISTQFAGTIDLQHTYDSAGIYKVTVRATDKNGLTAFLQLVGVANGAITTNVDPETNKAPTITRVLWLPAGLCVILIFVAFWLGRRYELAALRRHLEQRD
ncbi:MAG: hypothetical protein ABWX94_02160 [Candidatus Saccharimonadales bacterium]